MKPNGGAALLLVILLVSLLAVMVVEFQREARLELRTAANLRDALQVHALARSGISVASVLLLSDDGKNDDRDEFWAADLPPVPLGDAIVEVSIRDLDGAFPLGTLVDERGRAKENRVQAFERFLFALSQHLKDTEAPEPDLLDQVEIADLVDSLVDWIDADQQGGFEVAGAPNAPLEHLDELYRIEPYRWAPEGYGHAVADAILPYVDVRRQPDINVNTAEPPVLAAVHPDLDYTRAADWYDELTDAPAQSEVRLQDYSASRELLQAKLAFPLTTASKRFRVRLGVRADVDGAYEQSEAVLVRDQGRVRTTHWREGLMRDPVFWKRRQQPDPLLGDGFPAGDLFQ